MTKNDNATFRPWALAVLSAMAVGLSIFIGAWATGINTQLESKADKSLVEQMAVDTREIRKEQTALGKDMAKILERYRLKPAKRESVDE